jgi:hypothetical protein
MPDAPGRPHITQRMLSVKFTTDICPSSYKDTRTGTRTYWLPSFSQRCRPNTVNHCANGSLGRTQLFGNHASAQVLPEIQITNAPHSDRRPDETDLHGPIIVRPLGNLLLGLPNSLNLLTIRIQLNLMNWATGRSSTPGESARTIDTCATP